MASRVFPEDPPARCPVEVAAELAKTRPGHRATASAEAAAIVCNRQG